MSFTLVMLAIAGRMALLLGLAGVHGAIACQLPAGAARRPSTRPRRSDRNS